MANAPTYNWQDPSQSPVSLWSGGNSGPVQWTDNGLSSSGFTPTNILDSLQGLSGLGNLFGQQAAGNANNQIAQAELNQMQNQNALGLYGAQQNEQNQLAQLDLARQNFTNSNRDTTARQALVGALLGGGLQPTKIGPGGASGGILASLNANPAALQAMKTLGSQGSQAQNTPVSFQGGNVIAAPTLTPVPNITSSGTAKAGGILSDIAGIAGAVAPFLSFL